MFRRSSSPEINEESEEIRLILIKLIHMILEKYKGTHLLNSFINDFTRILIKTSTDPFLKVKLEAFDCIIRLTTTLEKDFHIQSESYVKPLLSNFTHQYFGVRVAAIKTIGAVVLSGNVKCFVLSINLMAEKLFDENSQVRLQVTLEVGNWMLNYTDRHSFWHRLIPLLVTSLSDSIADVRETAFKLWDNVGLQYMEENEEDLIQKTDFLKDIPSHYPDVKRPNLGCRILVQNNIGKMVPAINKEMEGWQADARLRCAHLLCWLILCAEEGSTQHANAIIKTLQRGAADDDERVVHEIKRASELFGYFIIPDTWWPLLKAKVDCWSALFVIAYILKGSRKELIKERVLGELCQELANPERCRIRTLNYQLNLLQVTEALMVLCKEDANNVAEQIFNINFTVFAMHSDDKVQFMALANLVKLMAIQKCGYNLTSLYELHIQRILVNITSDICTWSLLTPDRCLLECVMTQAGSAKGTQLHLISPLLKVCLTQPKVDPEVKLRIFATLSSMLLQRHTTFRKCEPNKIQAFLRFVIDELIMPNLVWSPGGIAEMTRTAALVCLCSVLQENPGFLESILIIEKVPDGYSKDKVILFPSKESLEPFLSRMVSSLIDLTDDNSILTRQHALRAIASLVNLSKELGCFTSKMLHKLYFVVLKRLYDSNSKARSFAAQTLCILFQCRPKPYNTMVFNEHIDELYSAMLVNLDDEEMLSSLLKLSEINPKLLMKNVLTNIHLYNTTTAYKILFRFIEKNMK